MDVAHPRAAARAGGTLRRRRRPGGRSLRESSGDNHSNDAPFLFMIDSDATRPGCVPNAGTVLGQLLAASLVVLLAGCGGGEPVASGPAAGRSDPLVMDPPAAGVPAPRVALSRALSASAVATGASAAPPVTAKAPAGRLLDGPPGLAAVVVFNDYTAPEQVVSSVQRAPVRFAATVTPSATVAEVNALLNAIGGRIVEMRAGDTLFSFEVADSDKVDVRAQVMSRLENSIVLQSALPLN